MDVYSKPGSKVRFANPDSGRDYDIKLAKKELKVGQIYTIDYTDVGSWHTDVYLVEKPGIPFNSVHFANVK